MYLSSLENYFYNYASIIGFNNNNVIILCFKTFKNITGVWIWK